MANIRKNIEEIKKNIPNSVKLIVVTKTRSIDELREVYDAGERVFGENRPQELCSKHLALPSDIEWHLIGSLQTNKVKTIIPFVSMIHSVDSEHLLEVINKEAAKVGRVVDVLMEVFVATEQTKHGWEQSDLVEFLQSGRLLSMRNVRVRGLMGMASFTDDREQVGREFALLKSLFDRLQSSNASFDTLSMGMSGDYKIAIERGSNTVRVGSAIFL